MIADHLALTGHDAEREARSMETRPASYTGPP
jgi:hypothetical protein